MTKRLPAGTVTFLFTDIEGSTPILGRLGDADYSRLLAEHHRLLRAAFRKWGGRELDTKGDSFLVAFSSAQNAVAATVEAQMSVRDAAWPRGERVRVRMGLHTGEPLSTKLGYVGIDLHRAARVCSAGHGGQILMSEATRLIAESGLPPGASVRDLGEHRLPGLTRPQRLFQIVAAGLPADFPPLRTLVPIANNLPAELTSFVGRTFELSEIRRLLSETRLLTLMGTGGAGKTRLALQLGKEMLAEFKDGVWFVELASLSDPARVADTVASTLRVRERPRQPIRTTLAQALHDKRVLLLLDNCEHLVSACAELSGELLRGCPNLRIVATSRESLKVAGEVCWRVPSLSLPSRGRPVSVERLIEFEGIRLFIDRAKAVLPSFALTDQNAPYVAQLCRRLDGLPLAIELAAARARVLSAEQIARRLDDRFRLLTNGSRTEHRRSKTLEAVVDWSFNLLSTPERTVLRRLAVFAGGFTLAAAESIVAGDGVEADEVLDLLTQLVDKSLVIVEDQNGEGWFHLLETVRQFCQQRLVESGELGDAGRRHRDWYLALAERAEPEFYGRDQLVWYDRLEAEHDNLREALDWSLKSADHDEAVRLAGALYRFWHVRGHHTEGREWLDRVLTAGAAASPQGRAKAMYAAGSLANVQNDPGRATAMARASHELYQALGDKRGIARCVTLLGFVAMDEGHYDQAKIYLQEALVLSKETNDNLFLGYALNLMGEAARCQGDYVEARAFYEQALPAWQRQGDERGVAVVLDNLGRVASYFGDYDQAEGLLSEALRIRRKFGFMLGIATTLTAFAGVAAARKQPDRAARLLGAADAILAPLGASLYRADRMEYDRIVATVQAALGEARYASAVEEGKRLSLDEAISATAAMSAAH